MITLHKGDCLPFMRSLSDKSIGAIITDPPYLEGDFSYMLPEMLRVAKRVVLTPGKLESFNWIARQKPFWEYCWRNSTKSLGGSACLHIGWEPILAYGAPCRPLGNDVLDYTQKIFKETNGLHKWPKPLDLFKKLVLHFSNENETVLDPFMGSGTTGVACISLNRDFIGCEIDNQNFAVAEERLQKEKAQLSLFAPPSNTTSSGQQTPLPLT